MPAKRPLEPLDQLVEFSKKVSAPDALQQRGGYGFIADLTAARDALNVLIGLFYAHVPQDDRQKTCLEVWGRKAHRVALLQLLAICQRLSGPATGSNDLAAGHEVQRLGAENSMLVSTLVYNLLGCSSDNRVAGVGIEVMHYCVRMHALEAYSRLLSQQPEPGKAPADFAARDLLQWIRQGSLYLLDAALHASQLAHGYTAKCSACNKAGCYLFDEVQAALERSQLFEHAARSILHEAVAQAAAGREAGEELMTDVRFLGEAGLRLVRMRLPPRQAELQQLSRAAAGPCWQYVLALQVVQLLHAADGGPTYGLKLGAALLPLLPPEEPEDSEADAQDAASASAAGAARTGKPGEAAAKAVEPAAEKAKQPRPVAEAVKAKSGKEGSAAADRKKAAAAAVAAAAAAGGGASGSNGTGGSGGDGGGSASSSKAAESDSDGVEQLDTVFAEIALATWMSAHDPQRYAPSLYDEDYYEPETKAPRASGEVAAALDAVSAALAALPPPPGRQQEGQATAAEGKPAAQQQPEQQAASSKEPEQAAQQTDVSADAKAPEDPAAKRRAEKLAEVRAFQAQKPLLSRRAVYTLCVRLVNICMTSAREWESRRSQQAKATATAEAGAGSSQQPASAGASPAPAGARPRAESCVVKSSAGGESSADGAAASGPTAADGLATCLSAPAPSGGQEEKGAPASPAAVPAAGGPSPRLIPQDACLRLALDALECAAYLMRRRRNPSQDAVAAGGGAAATSTSAAAAAAAAAAAETELEELDELYDNFDAASYLLNMAMGGARGGREALPRPLEWWRAAVGVMNHAVTGGLRDQAVWDDQFRLRMLRPRLPPLPATLPDVAPPNVSRALEAGVLPCMERALRRAAPIQASNPYRLESLLNLVLAWPNLGWMLAYGDPQQAAALIATVGKLLRQQAAAAVAATTAAGSNAAHDGWRTWEPVCKFGERLLSTGLSMWAWLEQQDAPPPVPAAAPAAEAEEEAGGGGAAGAEDDAHSKAAADGGDDDAAAAAEAQGAARAGAEGPGVQEPAAAVNGGNAAPAPARAAPGSPSRQLAQMVAAATALWLPALSELARGLTGGNLLDGKDSMTLGRVAVNWAMAVTRACRQAKRAAAAAAAAAAGDGGDAAQREAAAAAVAEAEEAAAGYRDLLFRDVRYVQLLCDFGRSLGGNWIPQPMLRKAAPLVRKAMQQVENLRDAISRAHSVVLGDAVVQLVDTFPEHLRQTLHDAAAASGGGVVRLSAGGGEADGAAAAAQAAGGGASGSGSGTASGGRAGKGRKGSKGGATAAAAALPPSSSSSSAVVAATDPAGELVLPAAPFVTMLHSLMGPGGLAPRVHVLTKLGSLFPDGASATSATAEGAAAASTAIATASGNSSAASSGAAASGVASGSGGQQEKPTPPPLLLLPHEPPLLLLPPQAGLSLLPRSCSYPGCTSLDSDSEALLPLKSGACQCRAVRYCGKACQRAHWFAGHRAVCGPPPPPPPLEVRPEAQRRERGGGGGGQQGHGQGQGRASEAAGGAQNTVHVEDLTEE